MACSRSKRFRATHLTHDDPFRTHTQTVLHEVAHGDLARAFKVRRAGFEAHNVRLLELQFRGVFAGDDALFLVDVTGQTVQQVVLPEPVPPDIRTLQRDTADDLENVSAILGDRAETNQVVERNGPS
jgi:hypothetical protein